MAFQRFRNFSQCWGAAIIRDAAINREITVNNYSNCMLVFSASSSSTDSITRSVVASVKQAIAERKDANIRPVVLTTDVSCHVS